MTKTIPISKIDQTATDKAIKDHIEDDFAKWVSGQAHVSRCKPAHNIHICL